MPTFDSHQIRLPPSRVARRAVLPGTALLAALFLGGCGSSAKALPANIPQASAHAAAENAITVSPLPGTSDAAPQTEISFLGGAGTTVSDVQVSGSHSGSHAGKLEAYSTGTGESFVPSHAFTQGETVHVSAQADGKTVRTTFRIAYLAPVSQQQFPINPGDPKAIQHYRSAPTLTPSTVTVTSPAAPGATAGDFFLAPYQGKGSPGPMIVDQAGNLIWFHPIPAGDSASNFRVQQYDGAPVLTWWQGRVLELGFGQGHVEIYNTSYQPIGQIQAGPGYFEDLHEVRITPQGTAWIDAFQPDEINLSSIGGYAHAVVNDSIVEEIDIKTGLVMWEWHAIGHIALTDSYSPMPRHTTKNWDYVHVNSIDPGSSDDLLLSSRNTWGIYDIDLHTGAINWRIGGKHSSFKLGPGVKFYYQHDAEWQPGGMISVFDNGGTPPHEKQSRGLLLAPDLTTHTVSLVRAFTNPSKTLLAASQGDLLNLQDGNWLMGYGGLPNFTEFNAAGKVIFDATLGRNVQDFRTYVSPWTGQPTTPPSIAAQSTGATMTVEASWNGATSVASWKVLAGASPSSLAAVATANKTGFETTITATPSAPYVEVVALGSAGQTLGTSAAISPSS
jgi:Arylsulfotransferase (ASST)